MKVAKNEFRGIITADWHLRREAPRCRIDEDWIKTQRETLKGIVSLANKKKCPVYCIGDIFDTPKAATEVVLLFIQEMKKVKKGCYILAGNHDLPYHDWANVKQSAVGILMESFPLIETIYPQAKPFGLDESMEESIAFTHQLVFEDEKSCPPNVKAKTAQDILDQFPNAKWIFTGDMHHSFEFENEGRFVINPGCTNIQNAGMKGYSPKVAFVDTEKKKVEWLNLPNNAEDLVDDSYLEEQHERDERMDAFLERIEDSGSISLSFMDNLHSKMNSTQLTRGTKEVLQEVIEEIGEEK